MTEQFWNNDVVLFSFHAQFNKILATAAQLNYNFYKLYVY